jgi:hypothetical protein
MNGEIIRLNIGQVKITWLDSQNQPLTDNSPDPAMTFRFKIEGPGIDPDRVTKVELPPLDYSNNSLYEVIVHMMPHIPQIVMHPHVNEWDEEVDDARPDDGGV